MELAVRDQQQAAHFQDLPFHKKLRQCRWRVKGALN